MSPNTVDQPTIEPVIRWACELQPGMVVRRAGCTADSPYARYRKVTGVEPGPAPLDLTIVFADGHDSWMRAVEFEVDPASLPGAELTYEDRATAAAYAAIASPADQPPAYAPGRVFGTRFHIGSDGLVSTDAPAPDPDAPATREQAYALVHAGITAGLSIPININIYTHNSVMLSFDRNDKAAVDAWAAYLELPSPAATHATKSSDKNLYQADAWRTSVLPGWAGNVYCFIDTPASLRAAARKAAAAAKRTGSDAR